MPPFCRYPSVLKSALKRVRIIIYIYYINTPVFFRVPSIRFPVLDCSAHGAFPQHTITRREAG